MPRQPVKDPYEEIYLRRDRWWGLLREEWLAPKDGDAITWKIFAGNIQKAKVFHQDISGSYHPQTYVYYGSEDKHPSFESITWKMTRGPLSMAFTVHAPIATRFQICRCIRSGMTAAALFTSAATNNPYRPCGAIPMRPSKPCRPATGSCIAKCRTAPATAPGTGQFGERRR